MEAAMSFGMRDQDWVDPPEPPTFRAHCGDCNHFHECPCGAAASFDPDWEVWEAADQAYDLMRDLQMEEE